MVQCGFIDLNRVLQVLLSGWSCHLHEPPQEEFEGVRQPRLVDDVEDALLQVGKEVVQPPLFCAKREMKGWVGEVSVEVFPHRLQPQDGLAEEPPESRLTPPLPGEAV